MMTIKNMSRLFNGGKWWYPRMFSNVMLIIFPNWNKHCMLIMFTTLFTHESIYLLTINKFLIHKRRCLLTLKPSYVLRKGVKVRVCHCKAKIIPYRKEKTLNIFSTEIKFITNPNMFCLPYAAYLISNFIVSY